MKIKIHISLKLLILSGLLLLTNCKPEELLKVTKLQTGEIKSFTYHTATVSATFIDLSGNVTSFGHCWSENENPTTADQVTTYNGTAQKGEYTTELAGLNGTTKYYVKAYAIDGGQVIYGDQINFTTSETPTITVTSPTGTDHWIGGETHYINWTDNVTGNVKLFFYKNGAEPRILAESVSVNFYQWLLPNDLSYNASYTFRIESLDDNEIYGLSPEFRLSEPNGSTGNIGYNGTTYPLIKIGKQWWFQENLKTTKFRDGLTVIPNITDSTQWVNSSAAAYCYHANNSSNAATYGALYNWYAVNDSRGICPAGWHVPSLSEWDTLQFYLQSHGYNYDGTTNEVFNPNETNKIGIAMSKSDNWISSNEVGAVGNIGYTNYCNLSGFSALPGSFRQNDDTFGNIGQTANWWTTHEYDANFAARRLLLNSSGNLGKNQMHKNSGLSVRCIKD